MLSPSRLRRLSPRRVHRVPRNPVPEEVEALRDVTDEFVRNARTVAANDDIYDLEDSHSPAEPRVRRIKTPHLHHPEYARAARIRRSSRCLKDLWGTVRFDTGKLNMKSAGYGAPVEWHQDWAFYPHTNDDLAAVGIMLDDCDLENGPMMVIPGSHLGPVYDHHGPDGRFCGAMDPAACGLDLSPRCRASARPVRSPCITCARCTARRRISPARSGGFCCSNIAPPMLGRCSASPAASKNSTSCCSPASPALTPRLAPVPVRLPLPPAEYQGSIYENQRATGRRFFETAADRRGIAVAAE